MLLLFDQVHWLKELLLLLFSAIFTVFAVFTVDIITSLNDAEKNERSEACPLEFLVKLNSLINRSKFWTIKQKIWCKTGKNGEKHALSSHTWTRTAQTRVNIWSIHKCHKQKINECCFVCLFRFGCTIRRYFVHPFNRNVSCLLDTWRVSKVLLAKQTLDGPFHVSSIRIFNLEFAICAMNR